MKVCFRSKVFEGSYVPYYDAYKGHHFEVVAVHEGDHIQLKCVSDPTVIVQGRYDVVCPATSAWELHKAFPEAEFIIVPDAGHSVSEPGIISALVDATDKFKEKQ